MQISAFQVEGYESFVPVTNGILLTTTYLVDLSQTLTCFGLEMYQSSGKLYCVYGYVLWGIDHSDIII